MNSLSYNSSSIVNQGQLQHRTQESCLSFLLCSTSWLQMVVVTLPAHLDSSSWEGEGGTVEGRISLQAWFRWGNPTHQSHWYLFGKDFLACIHSEGQGDVCVSTAKIRSSVANTNEKWILVENKQFLLQECQNVVQKSQTKMFA